MEINFNMNAGGVNPLVPAKRVASGSNASDRAAFASSTALEAALKQVPDVRPEAVDRARELISDPDYPSGANLEKLAHLLATKLMTGN